MKKKNEINPNVAPEYQMPLKEVTELLIKHYGIKKGLFEASIRFAITIGGVAGTDNYSIPGISAGVSAIGLIETSIDNPNAVDASTLK